MKFVIPDTIPRAALITGGARQHRVAAVLAEFGFAIALQCQPRQYEPGQTLIGQSQPGIELPAQFQPAQPQPAQSEPGQHEANAGEDLPAATVVLPADLSDEHQTEALIARATEALGPIGVLINAANVSGRDAWDDATRATWDMHIETNLRAPFVLIQQFARALPPDREGVVINLLDQRIDPRLVSYTLSKAALWTLTQTMALALAPRVRVNGIAPSPAFRPTGHSHGARGQERRDDPDAIARAAVAILALRSMTGQMIVPDGVPDGGDPPRPA